MNKIVAATLVVLICASNLALAYESHPNKINQKLCSRGKTKIKMANARKVFKKGDLKEAIHILESLMDCAYKEKYEHGTIKEGTNDVIELLSQFYFANKDFEKCVEITSNFATQSDTVFAQYQKCLNEQVKTFGDHVPSSECKGKDLMAHSENAVTVPTEIAKQLELKDLDFACLSFEKAEEPNLLRLMLEFRLKGQSELQKIYFKNADQPTSLFESLLNDEESNCSLATPELLIKNNIYYLHLSTIGAIHPCSGGKSLDEVHEFYEILKSKDLKLIDRIKINLEG